MKIKLANTPSLETAIEVTNISRSLFIGESKDVKAATPKETIQINIEDAQGVNFDTYKNFFQNGDVSTIEVYDSHNALVVTLHGKAVESVSQNINNNTNAIYVMINA